jgi:hypothetical protein
MALSASTVPVKLRGRKLPEKLRAWEATHFGSGERPFPLARHMTTISPFSTATVTGIVWLRIMLLRLRGRQSLPVVALPNGPWRIDKWCSFFGILTRGF